MGNAANVLTCGSKRCVRGYSRPPRRCGPKFCRPTERSSGRNIAKEAAGREGRDENGRAEGGWISDEASSRQRGKSQNIIVVALFE